MAMHYLGLNKGVQQTPGNIQHNTATTSTDIELRWDDTKNIQKKDIIQMMMVLEMYLEGNGMASGSQGADIPTL